MIEFVRQFVCSESVREFAAETAMLLPFLFATYLVLESIEAHAGGALERFLERARSVGPFVGALAGTIPQCGVSAAASSLYAGGVISVGALLAVFLSTSDELLPVLISHRVPVALMARVVGLKVVFAIVAGFMANGILAALRRSRRRVTVGELCEHSRCGCHAHKGILVPALIHTLEIFVFIAVISGAIELCLHFFGSSCLMNLRLTKPIFGEFVAGTLGLVPNCAVSVAAAELYCQGALSGGALMASSFAGSGLGLLVLFRTNRSLRENLAILLTVWILGIAFGFLTGGLL